MANGKNSIDVDKFDYIARDTQSCGLKSSFDHARLMCHSRVIDNEICFHAKEALNAYNLFNTRYTLFKQVYTHRAGKSVEYMVTDALVEADIAWNRKLSKSALDPELYIGLTDGVLRSIGFAPNEDGHLGKAKAIVKRIRKRNLYVEFE